ncbi:CBS domain-containing protein [candidate division WOR-3 bacterium]|nr:CBS domain-containing protein [candidate division WOR-3 bacterium]
MKRVKDIMFKDVKAVTRSTTLKEILTEFMAFHTYPLVPVLEEQGRLSGLISIDNIVDLLRSREPAIIKTIPFIDERPVEVDLSTKTPEMGYLIVAEDIMDTEVLTVEGDMPIEEVLSLMQRLKKNHFAVTDKDRTFLGVIGIFDIIINIFIESGIIEDV